MGVRPDVEILRLAAEQQVAHAAANEIGDVVVVLKPVQDAERVRIDVPPRDRMSLARDDHGAGHGSGLYDPTRNPQVLHLSFAVAE